jgi:hypothetical protein
MEREAIDPILDELFSSLVPLDTQVAALLQFLKAKNLATDEELAPFLEQAAEAASVRWLAVRVRTAALIGNLMKSGEKQEKPGADPTEKNAPAVHHRQEPQPEDSEDLRADEGAQAEGNSTSSKTNPAETERESPAENDLEGAA